MVETGKVVKNDKRYKPRVIFERPKFFSDWDVGPEYEV